PLVCRHPFRPRLRFAAEPPLCPCESEQETFMLILLPPSETKRVGGEGVLQPGALHGHQHEEMRLVRRRVREALEELSRGDEEAAAKALKLGVKNRSELQHNLRLHESGVM